MEQSNLETIGFEFDEQVDADLAQLRLTRLERKKGRDGYEKDNKAESQPTGRPHHMPIGERTLARRGHAG